MVGTVLPTGRVRRYALAAMAAWTVVAAGVAAYLNLLHRAEVRQRQLAEARKVAGVLADVFRSQACAMRDHRPEVEPPLPAHLPLEGGGRVRLLGAAAGGPRVEGTILGAGWVRVREPLELERCCLDCHAHGGERAGGLAGAIEVTLPVRGALDEELAVWRFELGATGAGWLLALAATAWAARRFAAGQREREAQEARLRALFEGARDALFVLEGERVVACNAAAERLLALPRERIVGAAPWTFSPPAQPGGGASEGLFRGRVAAARGGEPQLFEWVVRRSDGTDVACEVQLNRFEVEGRPLLLAAVRDVSARKEQEAALELLWRAVQQAAESVMITDAGGTILYVNPAFETVTGYARDEAVGRNPRLLKSGQHDEAFYRELWETITSGRVWRGTFVNRRKDGTLYREEAVITPVRDDRGEIRYFVAVRRDVTRERELEERLRLAERMETIGQLASVVAHDFNNLLMAILGAAEAAARHGGEAVADDVESIRHAVRRGADLTRRLLTVARQQVIEPVDLDLSRFLVDVAPTLRRLVPENIRLEVIPCDEPAGVHADPTELERILMNLVANARDAMPSGGELVVECSVVELGPSYVAGRPWAREGRYTLLAVTDTGVGMDQETLSHVFEPFFTTKKGRGTGLGLATVYGLVEQHGGFINVYSEPGEGTTFKIYLPWVEVEPGGKGRRAEERGKLPRGTETILVVEDDPGVRDGIRGILESLGYTVLVAASGEEALDVLAGAGSDVGLVLSDVVLPGMDGGELERRARELRPGLRFVFTSGYTDNVVHERFRKRPGVRFLLKPYGVEQLARTVRDALDGGGDGEPDG